jgi:hypothetical protein
VVTRKSGKVVTIPLAPRTARTSLGQHATYIAAAYVAGAARQCPKA